MKDTAIVVIGGGTGTYAVLTGLKKYPTKLSAIVTMSDDGGSTGLLRDELGVLPPGDVRRCLVALSRSDRVMRELMNYRFESGGLKGHSFGNILLSALEKVTGSFDKAVEKASDILRLEGDVIPVTLDKIRLVAHLENGKILRKESDLHEADLRNYNKLELEPEARANPKAIKAIMEADAIVIGPGDFYCSLVPNLLVPGIPEAIKKSKAKKIFPCNLMAKAGQTEGWTAQEFAEQIEKYIGAKLDYILYNNKSPSPKLLGKYMRKGEHVVVADSGSDKRFVGADLVHRHASKVVAHDPLASLRTLIRHDPDKLAKLILQIIYTY